MPLTKQQIGKGLKRCREKFCLEPRYKAAAIASVHPDVLRKREAGKTSLTVSDLLTFAEAWEVEPTVLFAELLHQCDASHWERVASHLDCTVAMAKHRLELAQRKHKMGFGQVWALYLQEQIRL